MNNKRATILILINLSIVSSGLLLPSCKKKSTEGMVIFTLVPATRENQTQIAAIEPGKPDGAFRLLTESFFAALSPRISFDGMNMLFSAQKKQSDPWQIWEMNLGDLKARQITSSMENCADPAYLPDGRILFSKINLNDTLKGGLSLYTCNRTGSEVKRITFNPHSYSSSNVLKDGRILTISKQVYPSPGDPSFMVLRPDGTKSELFYKGDTVTFPDSRGSETTGGRLVFIESGTESHSMGNITSISYNRPLHSKVNLTSGIEGDFHSVFPMTSGKLLVSFRRTNSESYALYEFDPNRKVLGDCLYNNSKYNITDPVITGKHELPKRLPSEVDPGVKTGLLLCQDINFICTECHLPGSLPKTDRIRIMGIDSALGDVKVETDGSFYLKVIADKPFQIQRIDVKGNIMNGPCEWIWLRPNERRGCVGCHEDPEQVPENRVPLAVKNSPVNVPVHIIKVIEKKVSLE